VAITNGGAGSLEALSAAVAYGDGQPADWLQAILSGTTAPAQLTLTARGEALGAGMYEADVRIASTSSSDGAEIAVALSVAGLQVIEDGGATSVREGGEPDQFSVVLSARPSTPVVLDVNAADPAEITVTPAVLRFTTTNWNLPQTVTVRAAATSGISYRLPAV
jgi:hypothetical protein